MTLAEGGGSPAASHQPALTNALTNDLANSLTNKTKESKEMNSNELTRIAKTVGAGYGYDEVIAEFSPYRDFKLRWTRSYKWIEFGVSDYLADAPEDVIEALMDTVFRKIRGDACAPYPEPVVRYITAPGFVERHQPTFLRRFRTLDMTAIGWVQESVERIRAMGLEVPEDIAFGVDRAVRDRAQAGKASVLMKVAAMNHRVESLPEAARDYAVWAQVAYIAMGFNPTGERRQEQYEALLNQFPGREEAERVLRRAGLTI